MTQQTSPYVEAKWGWNLGESGWNTGMDENLLKFSFLFSRNIDGIVNTLPVIANGQAYFLTTDKRIYFGAGGSTYSTPVPKWFTVYNVSTGEAFQYDGTTLSSVKSVTDIESDIENALISAETYTDNLRADLNNSSDLTKGSFQVANTVRYVSTVTELRSLPVPSNSRFFILLKEHTSGTGKGGGYFEWKSSITTADDNGVFIKPNSVLGSDPGRYERLGWNLGEVNPHWWGGVGNGDFANESVDTSAILKAVATTKDVFIPPGVWIFSPLTTPISFPSPYTNEGNRTSACLLNSGQTIRGCGKSTMLRWGTSKSSLGNLPQCFFKVSSATDVSIKDLYARDAFALLIVDPSSDGSVDGVVVKNCTTYNNLIDVIAGRQLAIDAASKFSKNISIMGNKFSTPGGSHAVVLTNTYNAIVTENNFTDVTMGMCVDISQGTKGCVLANNIATNCQYFTKVESSDVTTTNEELLSSYRVSITGNIADTISQSAVLLNGAADRVSICSNVFTNFALNGVLIGQSYNQSHPGAVTISGNVLVGISAGANSGIYDTLTNGVVSHVITGNMIRNVIQGVWIARSSVQVVGGYIEATTNGVVIDNSSSVSNITIGGGLVIKSAGVGINFAGSSVVKDISVNHCSITYTSSAFYSSSPSSIVRLQFSNNKLTTTSGTLGAIVLTVPVASIISQNIANLNSSQNFITTNTSTTDCIVSLNISTRPISLAAPTSSTINSNNITTAVYST